MLHKVEDKRRLANKIGDRLKRSPEVRPFPAAVTQLVSACQDANADSRTFETIIERDPALSGKILRMANSPMFCPVGQVKSIAHAVSLLGIRKLKSIATAIAGEAMFSSGDGSPDQRLKLWDHSIGCAVVARCVATHFTGVDADQAFLAGVFHDIGKLLFYDTIPDEYSQIAVSFSGLQLVNEEEFLFGTTHEMVGLASAKAWDLPNEIKAAIGWHHRPEQAESCPEYARIIHAADRLAKHWGIGSDSVTEEGILEKLGCDMAITEAQFDSMEEEAGILFNETTT